MISKVSNYVNTESLIPAEGVLSQAAAGWICLAKPNPSKRDQLVSRPLRTTNGHPTMAASEAHRDPAYPHTGLPLIGPGPSRPPCTESHNATGLVVLEGRKNVRLFLVTCAELVEIKRNLTPIFMSGVNSANPSEYVAGYFAQGRCHLADLYGIVYV